MPSVYTFPIWLLTDDDTRNGDVADMIEEDLESFLEIKKNFYSSLEGTVHDIKELHDLLEIQRISTLMLLKLFRSNLNIFNSALPEIDVVRIKDRAKQTLGVWRRESFNMGHPFGDGSFFEVVHKPNKWDDHTKFTDGTQEPLDWNGIVLSRFSDIHRHLHDLFAHGEARMLLALDTDVRVIVSTILPAVTNMYKELLGYINLVNTL